MEDEINIDEPLWSIGRILRAIGFWLWMAGHDECNLPFWYIVIYNHRPYAAHKAGVY